MFDAAGIRAVLANYARRNRWLEPDELRQEAAVALLASRQTWRPGGAPLDHYQTRAVTLALWAFTMRARSPVSASRSRLPLTLKAERADELAASQGVLEADPEGDLDRARLIRRAVALAAAVAPPAARVLYGERPREVAAELGVPVQQVYRQVRSAKARIREALSA